MSHRSVYWLHALSPTHACIGRGVGYIDLPIDRDGVTNWPLIRGSSFKGVWADHFTQQEKVTDRKINQRLKIAFGLAGENDNSNAGALIPTDARLVCLPVRSFRGTFAWCTSPLCLSLLRRTLERAGMIDLPPAPPSLPDDTAHHTAEPAVVQPAAGNQAEILLEDLNFKAKACHTAQRWANLLASHVFPGDMAWQEQFKKRFVVLPDLAFDFLTETATEVHTRVRIHPDTKIVAEGQLWTEESLPAESILVGVIQCDRVFGPNPDHLTPKELLDHFATNEISLQIGGKATVGRGQMRCVFSEVGGGQ